MTISQANNIDVQRSKTFSWSDPVQTAKAALTSTGLEFLTRMIQGEVGVPPVMDMIGFRLVHAEFGKTIFEYDPDEPHYNPIGSVHGGIMTTLLDTAMGSCIHTTLPQGVGFTTLEVKVNFIRQVSVKTGLMRCEGNVIHSGSRIATSEARLVDASGKLYAYSNSTCLVLSE
jgi:uncharacterized protein (TIGR00369 family)